MVTFMLVHMANIRHVRSLLPLYDGTEGALDILRS